MQDGDRANQEGKPEPDPARHVRETWELLATTPWRDYFIASHPEWQDSAAVHRQAVIDAQHYLDGIDRGWLARQHVLEIGCGVGRIARVVRDLARSYTGIDIAEGMVREARRRCHDLIDTRFLVTDGTAVPPAALDRQYGLALAAAVFIHCPKDVIAAMVRSAWAAIARGGRLRMQLNVDPADPEGWPPAPAQATPAQAAAPAPAPAEASPRPAEASTRPAEASARPAEASARPAEASPRPAEASAPPPPIPPEAHGLLRRVYYVGHPFRVAEARADLAQWTLGRVVLHRLGADQLYADVTKE
jgi:SAM-dependent methyltransferase